jgi:hypothetical protein
MSPMDSFAYFENPTYTEISIAGTTKVRIAQTNPRRICLFIMTNTTGLGGSVNFAPSSQIGLQGGLSLSSSAPYILISNDSYGNLSQCEWWCYNPGAGSIIISVSEIVLNNWPVNQEQDNGQIQSETVASDL